MDWVILLVLACFALAVFAKEITCTRAAMWVGLFCVLASLAGAWGWHQRRTRLVVNQNFVQTVLPHAGRPGGYVSSDRCLACHPDEYQSWHHSFHRTMTQLAQPDTVRGNFNQITLSLSGKTYQLGHEGNEFLAELEDPDSGVGTAGGSAQHVWRRIG